MKRYSPVFIAVLLFVFCPIRALSDAREISVGGEDSGSCAASMQKYLLFTVGSSDYEENKELLAEDFLSNCEEYKVQASLEDRSAPGISSGDAGVSAKLVLDEEKIRGELVSKGFLADGGASSVVFATEFIGKRWRGPQFLSLDKGSLTRNECEDAIYGELSRRGISSTQFHFPSERASDIRRLRSVVMRYKDISTIPNDTALRAARMMDPSVRYVVSCGVRARSSREGNLYNSCSLGKCKVVDSVTKNRSITAADSLCSSSSDEGDAFLNSIGGVCRTLGARIAKDILKIQRAGGNK